MFSRSRSGHGRHNFGQPKKESGGKRHHIRTWVFLNKKKRRREEGVMMSGDSPPPLHASTSFSALDGPDDSRGKITPPLDTSLDKPSTDTEMDVSKEEVPIIQTTVPAPEPRPKIEKNGFDRDMIDGKKPVHDVDDDSCLIKCVYFTQQCCECRIL
ncbi:uncharacterized protein LOC105703260 isoform X2 [Orussus abietinus]|uniref:uncharacterized protein LOC105703260 isoform X2 n=1 Tax=Orussus abietinus TaxID=222816 RepID=UPI0006257145|nr:uncharacterized protein LOC105703260 isoform X2 [Orussus abietinus]